MSNDKREPWRTVSDEVMATYADTAMGTTHAVEMAAEKGYDLGKHHGRKEALESGEAWAKWREAMGPGVGPAWQIAAMDAFPKAIRIVLETSDLSIDRERLLRSLCQQSLPVDVTAYPAAPATNERDAREARGHRRGMEDALGIAHGCDVDDTSFKAQAAALREHLAKSYARGQAAEAEQVQARAAASATRATMYRNGVALLDREIATLKGEGK